MYIFLSLSLSLPSHLSYLSVLPPLSSTRVQDELRYLFSLVAVFKKKIFGGGGGGLCLLSGVCLSLL